MSDTSSTALPPRLSKKKLTLIELDISRSTSLINNIGDDEEAVLFFDGFYGLCTKHIEAKGGEIIKYMGDSCLATFGGEETTAAIDAVVAIREEFPAYCQSRNVAPTDIHGTVHVGDVIVGQFGPQGFKDVMGRTPNTLFKTAGQGITITEQVYRKLPSNRRTPWRKRGGQVTYVLK